MAVALDPPPILGLVAEPVRWRLLAELAKSDRRVGELTQLVDKPQNLVSYHLGELRKAGVVRSHRSSYDGRDVYYRADLRRCADLLALAAPALHPALGADNPRRGRSPRARTSVLFLCTGNSARSQMAAALLEDASRGAVRAQSAGSHPKPLHPHAVRAMAKRGLDIAGQASTHFDHFHGKRFDRVVTLCDKVREVCPEFPGSTTTHWSVADPAAAGTVAAFTACAEDLAERVTLLVGELTEPERTRHAR